MGTAERSHLDGLRDSYDKLPQAHQAPYSRRTHKQGPTKLQPVPRGHGVKHQKKGKPRPGQIPHTSESLPRVESDQRAPKGDGNQQCLGRANHGKAQTTHITVMPEALHVIHRGVHLQTLASDLIDWLGQLPRR